MTWGQYGIAEAGFADNGNAAVCVFRLYNKRKQLLVCLQIEVTKLIFNSRMSKCLIIIMS
mgnify:FL=1